MSWSIFLSMWSWYPSVLAGCGLLLVAYLALIRFHLSRRALAFGLGLVALLLALVSPIDALGDTYLFSAHMLQHLLLLMVVPPLLLLGIPREAGLRLLHPRFLTRLERAITRPLLAWLMGIGTIWGWHIPALYNAALANEQIHQLEHITFLVTAIIFWWPVLSPMEERRMRPAAAIPYLFFASAASSILGIILAFAHPGLYPAYLSPVDAYGILPVLRSSWGITPAFDQQAGGLMMWVAGTPVYLFGALSALSRWYGAAGQGEELHGS